MKKFLDNSTFLQWVGTVHKIILLFANNWSQLLEYDHVKSFWIPYTLQIENATINQKNTSDEAHNTSTNTYGTKYRLVLTTSPEFLGIYYPLHQDHNDT